LRLAAFLAAAKAILLLLNSEADSPGLKPFAVLIASIEVKGRLVFLPLAFYFQLPGSNQLYSLLVNCIVHLGVLSLQLMNAGSLNVLTEASKPLPCIHLLPT
jgi:hypothetical protein